MGWAPGTWNMPRISVVALIGHRRARRRAGCARRQGAHAPGGVRTKTALGAPRPGLREQLVVGATTVDGLTRGAARIRAPRAAAARSRAPAAWRGCARRSGRRAARSGAVRRASVRAPGWVWRQAGRRLCCCVGSTVDDLCGSVLLPVLCKPRLGACRPMPLPPACQPPTTTRGSGWPAGRGDLRADAADDALAVGPAERRSCRRCSSPPGAGFRWPAACVYLLAVRRAGRAARSWRRFAVSALGTVVGFPLFCAGAAPSSTRCTPPWSPACCRWPPPWRRRFALRQRPRRLLGLRGGGCALVVAFALLRGSGRLSRRRPALLLAPWRRRRRLAYVAGARLAAQMPAEQVICWVLVLSLPLTLPVTLLAWPRRAGPMSWGASPTWRCSRCGWASSPGTAASRWRHGARQPGAAGAALLSRCCSPCRCWANGWMPLTVGFSLAVIATVFSAEDAGTAESNPERTGEPP